MSKFNANASLAAQQAQQQLLTQATKLQQNGRWGEAIPILTAALANDPKNLSILLALATCNITVERLSIARDLLKKAIKLAPRDARPHQLLAYAWKREAAFEKALAAIDEAIAIDRTNPQHVAVKAEILHMAGRSDDAMRTLEPVLSKASSVPAVASVFAAVAQRVKRQREAIPPLEAILGKLDLPTNARIKFSFDLATLYDTIGEYEKAWTYYQRGNDTKHERWNIAEHTRLTDAAMAAWNRSTLASLPKSPIDGSPFVFIVGMPRSGTSLVEQIIATDPGVFAAGERNEMLRVAHAISGSMAQGMPMVTDLQPLRSAEAIDRHARTYATAVRALTRASAPRITDKMPPNFLNLGLVQALLPGAKVIHCRREAMDSCLSCYFQLFGGALSFAYDLTNCGSFYVEYERLMSHWKRELDLPILDVQYESLVADQVGGTQRIFEFLGLPFTDAALRFHDIARTTLTASSQQVREPIYQRSIGRWKHYDSHLAPLRAALGSYAS